MVINMNSNALMKAGAVAGIFLSIFAVLISDMHTISDLILTLIQNGDNQVILPNGIEFPYWVTGVAASPILVTSIFLFGIGFIGAWKKTGERMAIISAVVAFIYATTHIFAALADIQYAKAVEILQVSGDLSGLAFPGMLRGVSALIIGITGGFIMTSCMAIYFHRSKNSIGKAGALLALVAIFIGIFVKTLALWFLPYEMMVAFLLLMCLKSVGITFMSGALYQQAVA